MISRLQIRSISSPREEDPSDLRQVRVVFHDGNQVKALIPKKASREEWSGGNTCEKVLGSLCHRFGFSASLRSLFPEALIFLVVGRGSRTINHIVTMEKSDPANQIRYHGLGESGELIIAVKWRLRSKHLPEPIRERQNCFFLLLCNCVRYVQISKKIIFSIMWVEYDLTSQRLGGRTR